MKKNAPLIFLIALPILFCIFSVKDMLSIQSSYSHVEGQILEELYPPLQQRQYGAQLLYFGSSSSADCSQFTPILQQFLEETGLNAYYYDVDHWKDQPQFDLLLSQYRVQALPTVVAAWNGSYHDAYRFRPEYRTETALEHLHQLAPERGSYASPITTSSGIPMEFEGLLQAFTFALLWVNVLYLVLRRQELIQRQSGSPLLFAVANATLLFALHVTITMCGWSYAVQFHAVQNPTFFAQFGRLTCLLATPALYFMLLWQCMNIRIAQNERKKQQPLI